MSGGYWTRRGALLALMGIVALLVGCGGGGGGGGAPSGNITVTGTVLVATNDQPPSPPATVTVGGHSATTDTAGNFTIQGVAKTATTGTVSASGMQTLNLTVKLFPDANNNAALGNIFISTVAYTAVATGTVVSEVNGSFKPVSGASVTISGDTTTTAADGTFQISNLAVGTGEDPTLPIGLVQATGFVSKPLYAVLFPLASGTNNLGQIVLGAPISGTSPSPPYTITGQVLKGTQPQPGVSVAIVDSSGNVLGNPVVSDSNGAFFFWVIPGTYNLIATIPNSNQEIKQPVTLKAANVPVTQNITLP